MPEIYEHIENPINPGKTARLVRKVSTDWIKGEYQKQVKIDVSNHFTGLNEVILAECATTGYRFFHPPEVAGDGSFYESLQHFEWYYVKWKWEHQKSLEFIKVTDSVLEIGCGKGDFLNALKMRGQASVVGMEMNQFAADYARNNFGLNVFSASFAEFIEKENNQFDVVCSFQVLEHIADVNTFISQAISLLKPGGILLFGVPNADAVIVKDEPENILDYPPHHMGWWSKGSLRKICRLFPLEVISIEREKIPKERLTRYYYIRIRLIRKRFGILGKILDKLIYPISVPLLSLFRKMIPGHTILAVYRKNV